MQAPTGSSRRRRGPGAWALGAAALILIGNPELRAAALMQLDQVAELAGFGLQQVTLTGHRFTADADIYAALNLDSARTLLSFDPAAAKARIERLPWIERASIERIVPHGLDVHVSERVPFAVWRTEGRSWLIDRAGRRLQVAPADILPQLLRVAGPGAGRAAAALSTVLAGYPSIASRVESAERVGKRRWRLHLKGGASVDLPAEGEAGALARLTRLIESGLAGAGRIDLRVATRTLVGGLGRTSTAASGAAVPAGT